MSGGAHKKHLQGSTMATQSLWQEVGVALTKTQSGDVHETEQEATGSIGGSLRTCAQWEVWRCGCLVLSLSPSPGITCSAGMGVRKWWSGIREEGASRTNHTLRETLSEQPSRIAMVGQGGVAEQSGQVQEQNTWPDVERPVTGGGIHAMPCPR